MTDWPQVGQNAQRTNHSPDALGSNAPSFTWRHDFTPEARVNPQVQPIIAGGRVFVPTMGLNGNVSKLYAFSATTHSSGAAVTASGWPGPTTLSGPVWASVAHDGTYVHVCGLDGVVTRITAETGAIHGTYQRTSRYGYTASPLLADGQLFVCDYAGVVTSLNPATYAVNWQRQITNAANLRVPIIATPAHDGTHLIVARMDCVVTAIRTNAGGQQNTIAWNTPVEGCVFKDYYPVVTSVGGTLCVLVAPMPRYGLSFGGVGHGVIPFYRSIEVADVTNSTAMANKLADAAANPTHYAKTLYLLNATTGAEVRPLIHFHHALLMFGSPSPPAIDYQGHAITTVTKPGSWQGRWGRINLSTGHIQSWFGDYPIAQDNNDENVQPSCFSSKVVVAHVQDYSQAQFHGVYDQVAGTWARLDPSGPGTINPRWMGNMQSGKGCPMSGANGWLYHVATNQLVARNTN